MKYLEHTNLKFDIEKMKSDLDVLLERCPLHQYHKQISFTHTTLEYEGKDKNYEGCGSLTYAFGEKPFDEYGELVPQTNKLKETDFTEFNDGFKDLYFYDIYKAITADYNIGRMRLMCVPPKKCLSWHVDPERRMHIPIISNENCRIVIEDEAYYLEPNGSAYICDVTKHHTAFNGDHKLIRYNILIDLIE